ncbi:beta-ketoacyl synthase [Micrococcus cohnii]|uniref:3-oxoacyl-[acyl-carrier-protein] synthase 2 n=1 Tax=Micrococcus cohnii TaxID=993416 RepID=A0A7W7GMV3_9MICC|nr:beta-ketoacyl-[acyl-carrier-protein] synthase family protein [Micrococcus cohnii]MBB4735051.1 3-oxoacyl-[acyl-carrier-protein] synthase II [Micrococcus cohnii]
MTRTAVITGLGATTPIGGDVPTFWTNALAGVSGAAPLEQDWVQENDLPVTFAAQLSVPTSEVLKKVELKRQDPAMQMATVAAREAWADAGFGEDADIDHDRFAIAFGTGIGGVWTLLDGWDTLRERGPRRVMPMTVPMLMPNGAAGALSLEFGARAGAHTVVSACASGTESLSTALALIRSGTADVVMCGSTEAAIHPLPIAAFSAMQAMSRRNDDPQAASRPYDVDRDGFVLGEGAGVLIVESEEHAAARGARVYAELSGTGVTSDSHHITAPEPEGLGASRAMRAALDDAGLEPSAVCHVNAHATSTPVGDKPEYHAMRSVFGDHLADVQVSATKSQTGHLLGASGAIESVLSVLAAHHGTAPVTINLDEQDPEIDLNVVTGEPGVLPEGQRVVMKNSFGFGGHNAVAVFTGR